MLTARLEHLCRLVAAERRPYCPANGVLVLLPWADQRNRQRRPANRPLVPARPGHATPGAADPVPGVRPGQRPRSRPGISGVDRPVAARPTAAAARAKFPAGSRPGPRAIARDDPGRHSLGLRHAFSEPDLSTVHPGRRQSRNWKRRCQGECPVVPVAVRTAGSRGSGWAICSAARVVRPERGATLFGGCYFAATGRDAASEHAFCAGVFPLLADNQNFVSWTPEALAEEAKLRRWTAYGYAGLAVMAALLLVGGVYFWPA